MSLSLQKLMVLCQPMMSLSFPKHLRSLRIIDHYLRAIVRLVHRLTVNSIENVGAPGAQLTPGPWSPAPGLLLLPGNCGSNRVTS